MKKIIRKIVLIISDVIFKMKPAKTGQILNTNIYAINNFYGTLYLIKINSGYIMFDAGTVIEELEDSLKIIGVDAKDVKCIFLTHSDGDHVAGLLLFPNANIYMSEDELPLINGTVKRAKSIENKIPSGIDIDKIILLANDSEYSFDGIKIKCIKTPGHTIGHMVYLVDEKYLFSGDAFDIKKGKINVHISSMDAKLSKETIKGLEKTINNSSIIFTSHFGFMVNNST